MILVTISVLIDDRNCVSPLFTELELELSLLTF